jgi:hypothetical protein
MDYLVISRQHGEFATSWEHFTADDAEHAIELFRKGTPNDRIVIVAVILI